MFYSKDFYDLVHRFPCFAPTFRVEGDEIASAGGVRGALVDGAALVDAGLSGLGLRCADQQPEKVDESFFSIILLWPHCCDRHSVCILPPSPLIPGTDVMIFKIFSPKNWRKN
jgi:hypothetical protein